MLARILNWAKYSLPVALGIGVQVASAATLQDTINTATSTFQTTTGFGIDSVVTFMGTQVALIIGSGLGVLQSLLPWIVALVVIGAIIYFLYRAFRFFRH